MTHDFEVEHLPVFVYGTLRRGGSNHWLLEGKFSGEEDAGLPSAVLVDNGSYPFLLEHPAISECAAGEVKGTLIHVAPQDWYDVANALDQLEGYDPTAPVDDSNLYNRVQRTVHTASGEITAWVYIPPRAQQVSLRAQYPLIESGDWLTR